MAASYYSMEHGHLAHVRVLKKHGAPVQAGMGALPNGVKLRRGLSQGQRPDLLKPRATPWENRGGHMSPEGAAKPYLACDWAAPSGLTHHPTLTQGVALGFVRPGRWPS